MTEERRIIDRRTTATAPYPVAAAWSRVLVATSGADRQQRAVDAVGVVLRYLAAIAAADALQADPSVVTGQERLWAQLRRPSLGHWVELLRELTRHNSSPFVPELKQQLFTRRGKPSAVLHELGELVTLRNRVAHGSALERPEHGVIEQRLREVLDTQPWLARYRLMRVMRASPRRGGGTEGVLQLFVGQVAQTEPLPATWSARLVPDVVYLTAPDGERLLDVTPFLEVREDPSVRAPRCLLVQAIGPTLALESVETGQQVDVQPEGEQVGPQNEGNRWLDHAEPRVVAVPELAGLLAAQPLHSPGSEPVPPLEPTKSADATPPPPARWGRWLRRLAVLSAVGTVGLMGASFALARWLYPTYDTSPPAMTLRSVPQLYEDPADQRRLEAAHEAMVQGDELSAAMLLLPLLELDAIPPEVAAMTSVVGESLPSGASLRAWARVDPARREENGAAAHCARMTNSLLVQGTSANNLDLLTLVPQMLRFDNGMAARLETNPDDLVAVICKCMWSLPPITSCESAVDAFGDATEFPMLWDMPEMAEPSLSDIEAALELQPVSPTLRRRRALALMHEQRWSEAEVELEATLAAHPTRLDLRLLAAEHALLRGDEATFRKHYGLLRSTEWGPVIAHITDRSLPAAALRAGRPALALELWRSPERPDGWGSTAMRFAYYSRFPDLLGETLLLRVSPQMQLGVRAPVEDLIGLQEQKHHKDFAHQVELQLALRADPDSIPAELIEDRDRFVVPGYTDSMHVSAWRGDARPVLDADVLPADSADWNATKCAVAATAASLLAVAGERPASLEHWQRMLAYDECHGLRDIAHRAMAHGNLALAAQEDGDGATASRHAEAFAELWPRPEPDVPIVRRMVEAGLFHAPPVGAPDDGEGAPPEPE